MQENTCSYCDIEIPRVGVEMMRIIRKATA